MFISHPTGVQYYIGEYKDGKFTPEKHERMNSYGGEFFANESLIDDNGTRILWGWVLEGRTLKAAEEEEFLGTMSLPRELSLGEDGFIKVKPVDELKKLRTSEFSLDNQFIIGEKLLDNVKGRQLEIEFELCADEAKQAGVKICCSPDSEEETLVYYDFVKNSVVVDTSKGSQKDDIFRQFCC